MSPRSAAVMVVLVQSFAHAQSSGLPLPVDSEALLSGGIAGRVCEDLNGDGQCTAEEPGVAAVRLVLDSGHQVWTDGAGRYHFAAVPSRTFKLEGDRVRLATGRHRLGIDARTLPAGWSARAASVTLEVPMASVVLHHVALQRRRKRPLELLTGAAAPPPAGSMMGPDKVRFSLTGRAMEGAGVWVDGSPAQVDATGAYRMDLALGAGTHRLALTVRPPAGGVELFSQRVDVIARPGGLLVVPHAPQRVASLAFASDEGAVIAGVNQVRVEVPPGAELRFAGGTARAGADGRVTVPISLQAGTNHVPLVVVSPDGREVHSDVELVAQARSFRVGRLELEAGWAPGSGGLHLRGEGATHVEQWWGPWLLTGQLRLEDTQVRRAAAGDGAWLLSPSRPERFERDLDPERYPSDWGDASVSVIPNASGAHLRVEASREGLGRVGFGSHRAWFGSSEFGRYHRVLFGPYLELEREVTPGLSVGARAFGSPGVTDPMRPLASLPAHDELRATGGSVYFLRHHAVVTGSEVVRVELRDALTGLPVEEVHLVRGRDYDLDPLSGRILLARPLSWSVRSAAWAGAPLGTGAESVLVVDYERLTLGEPQRATSGGSVKASLGAGTATVGHVQEWGETGRYRLSRANVSVPLARWSLALEGARSDGRLGIASPWAFSSSGGLTYASFTSSPTAGGWSWGARLRGPALNDRGRVEAALRGREAGFVDSAHGDPIGLRQASVWVDQPFDGWGVRLLADGRRAMDPRWVEAPQAFSSRQLGVSVRRTWAALTGSVELRDSEVRAAWAAGEPVELGARSSVGAGVAYRVSPRVSVSAAHLQDVARRGPGPGAQDGSFSSAGVDLAAGKSSSVGLRAGYGPRWGPQLWGTGEVRDGERTWYAGRTFDADGVVFSQPRVVSGVREERGDAQVFVEDVASHDVTSLRLSRAVGLTRRMGNGWTVSGRYERGVHQAWVVPSADLRQAASALTSWERGAVRLYGRAELLWNGGSLSRGRQWMAGGGAQWRLSERMQASARLNAYEAKDAGVLQARWLEGHLGLSWRDDRWVWLVRWAVEHELPPPSRGEVFAERRLQLFSVQPSVRLGRFGVAFGAHGAWTSAGAVGQLVVSGAVRPSFEVLPRTEVALEVAGRTSAPDDGQLGAARAEVAYALGDGGRFALGCSLFGFDGLGVSTVRSPQQRVYLRAEVGW